jgi:hypothetical protein
LRDRLYSQLVAHDTGGLREYSTEMVFLNFLCTGDPYYVLYTVLLIS